MNTLSRRIFQFIVLTSFFMGAPYAWTLGDQFKRIEVNAYLGQTYRRETIRFQHLLHLDKYPNYEIEGVEVTGRSRDRTNMVLLINGKEEDQAWFDFGRKLFVPKAQYLVGKNLNWIEFLVSGSIEIDDITVFLKLKLP